MTRHGDTGWRSLHPPNTFLFCIQVHMYLFVQVHVHLPIAYFRETDKQRICVNTQLINLFTQLKLKERVLVYGYWIFWTMRHICNCHYIAEALEKTFTVTVILFNKCLACLNDNFLNDWVTDSTNIAFDFVNEIVNSSFESAQKPTAQIPAAIYARSRETH